jgi:dolichol-phosphate hexosyltransferase
MPSGPVDRQRAVNRYAAPAVDVQQPDDLAGTSQPARTLSVLMPVYNEVTTVEEAIREVVEATLPASVQLIVVDDGSTDGTRELLGSREWPDNVEILMHDRNRGKGAAVRTALGHATGDFSAIFDADLEYDPRDLVQLIEPLLAGEANAVFGSRAFAGHTSHSFLYVLGNKFVTLFCNVLFNVYIGDIMTCHKAIETQLFKGLGLHANGFTIEPEITARLLQAGERIFEVPVRYRARTHPEGKKLTSRDGLLVIGTLIRCRVTPRSPEASAGRGPITHQTIARRRLQRRRRRRERALR